MTVPCTYCGTALDAQSPYLWRRVIGWERKAQSASRKNGSDIACRESRHEYACDVCIRRMQRGVAPSQGQLV